MKSFKTSNVVSALGCCAALALSVNAQASQVFSDVGSFNAANPVTTLINFQDVTITGETSTTIDPNRYAGITLPAAINSDGNLAGTNFNAFPLGLPTANTQVLFNDTAGSALTLNFSNTTVVGLNLAIYSGGNAVVNAYDGSTLLSSQTIATDAENVFDTFIGFSGFGAITSLTITPTDPNLFALAGNIQINSVPVPGAAWLFGSALGMLAFNRRSSRA